MSKQALGNVLAGVAFLIVAIVDFTRDSSGIGVVFLVFAAVFLRLGLAANRGSRPVTAGRLVRPGRLRLLLRSAAGRTHPSAGQDTSVRSPAADKTGR
jgi:hypothetical protein